jgi:hypothetical protein
VSSRPALVLCAAWLAWAATACAPRPAAPPPRAPGVAAQAWFPLVDGGRWVYEVRAGFGKSRLEVTAQGLRAVKGAPAPLFIMQERSVGGPFGMQDDGLAGYLIADGYLSRFSFLSRDPDGGIRLMGSEPTRVLPVEPREGEGWMEQTHVFTTPESRGGEQTWRASVERVKSLRVPAGTFHDLLLVRSDYLDPTVSKEPLVSYEDYYARGVGLVRSVSHNRQAHFWNDTLEQDLVEVSFVAPAAGAARGAPRGQPPKERG